MSTSRTLEAKTVEMVIDSVFPHESVTLMGSEGPFVCSSCGSLTDHLCAGPHMSSLMVHIDCR